MAINFLKPEEIEEKIGKGKQIISFYSDWCGPCKMMAPILEEISEEIEVYKVSIDSYKEYAKSKEVTSIPDTRLYENGKLIEKIVGFVPKEKILEIILNKN